MKKLTKAVALAVGTALASQAAHAQFANNYLYLGFNESGAPSDYIINLGAASGIIGQSSVVDLSSYINMTTFNSLFSSPTGVGAGVVGGGKTTGLHPLSDIYLTAERSGPGNSAFADSTLVNPTAGAIDGGAYAEIAQNLTWAGAAGGSSGSTTTPDTSWTSTVGPALVNGNFYSDTGNNPVANIGASGVLYEDLYYNLSSDTSYTYQGYFTLDLSGDSPSLTFTGVNAVPEPTVLGLLGGAGLLLLSLRSRLGAKNA